MKKPLFLTLFYLFLFISVECRNVPRSPPPVPSSPITAQDLKDSIKRLELTLIAEAKNEAAKRGKSFTEVMEEAEAEAVVDIMVHLANETNPEEFNEVVPASIRNKRQASGRIGRILGCLMTIIMNPTCILSALTGGEGEGGGRGIFVGLIGGGGEPALSAQAEYNEKLRAWIKEQEREIQKFNETQGYAYSTPFPVKPPSPPRELDTVEPPRRRGLFGFVQSVFGFIPRTVTVLRSYWQTIQPLIGIVRSTIQDRISMIRRRGGPIATILATLGIGGDIEVEEDTPIDNTVDDGEPYYTVQIGQGSSKRKK